jgi:hypothetical protein
MSGDYATIRFDLDGHLLALIKIFKEIKLALFDG